MMGEHDVNVLGGDFLDIGPTLKVGVYDLVIADPPYFKVVNEKWDYQWSTLQDYLGWTERWLKIAHDRLRFGGSLFLFGYFRSLAHVLRIAEEHGFELRQQIIIDKGMKSVAGRKTSTYRMFPNVTESVLFFIKDNKKVIKPLLKGRAEELGLKPKQINERLGVKSNGGGMWSIYTGKNMCEQFPTRETWGKLMGVLEMDLSYEKYAQTFNPAMGLTDVWSDFDFYANNRIHPTEKPYRLIERLILATTNPGDRVLDPFSGSGISGLVAAEHGRRADLCEIDAEYASASVSRMRSAGLSVSHSLQNAHSP